MIQIDFSREALDAICRRRAVKRLALFGSVVRDDFGPDSDVDVLVEFDYDTFEGKQVYKIYDELTELFGGRKIDLVEVEFVNRRLRERILEEAHDVFAA
jgi:predicted nucleotidyltransferase